jgi:hypothetical protein
MAPATAPSAAVETKVFTLAPTPGRAEIWLDGTRQPDFNPGHNTVAIPWDRDHTLEFRNECCPPVVRHLGPGRDVPVDNHVIARFEGKPALVLVSTEPAAPGRFGVTETDPPPGRRRFESSGALGEEIFIPFEGDSDMVKNLEFTIDADGRAPKNVSRTVHAGEKLPVKVPLGE